MSKIDATKNLIITEIWPANHPETKDGGIGVDWLSEAGWGQCIFVWDKDKKLHAYTEHMCSNENKTFIKAILELLVDEIIVED